MKLDSMWPLTLFFFFFHNFLGYFSYFIILHNILNHFVNIYKKLPGIVIGIALDLWCKLGGWDILTILSFLIHEYGVFLYLNKENRFFKVSYLCICYWVLWVPFIFWILTYNQCYDLQILSSFCSLLFLFCWFFAIQKL